MGKSLLSILIVLQFCFLLHAGAQTKIVLLGTGTPNADPERHGPATAIIVNGNPYIIDCGTGVVRRAVQAGIKPADLSRLFITHLHSDHTLGYADMLMTPGVLERKNILQVYGPTGTKRMDDYIRQAYSEDYKIRIFGLEKGDSNAYKSQINEITPGLIYADKNVRVTAFAVNHGGWKESYGFKFETPDKTIVISGDCTYSESIIQQCNGCDVLIHEVYSEDGYSRRPAKWKAYHSDFHTSSSQLAMIASLAKPKLVIVYHQLLWDSTEEKLLQEIRTKYKGLVVSGQDLSEY